jgi:hypothetical protein
MNNRNLYKIGESKLNHFLDRSKLKTKEILSVLSSNNVGELHIISLRREKYMYKGDIKDASP